MATVVNMKTYRDARLRYLCRRVLHGKSKVSRKRGLYCQLSTTTVGKQTLAKLLTWNNASWQQVTDDMIQRGVRVQKAKLAGRRR
jgi:hypothetical protein